jgi:hypothetical protein
MAVVPPAVDMSSDKPNAITQTALFNVIKKGGLSIQVRSRSPSPEQEYMPLQQLSERKIAKLSAEGPHVVIRKRHRA